MAIVNLSEFKTYLGTERVGDDNFLQSGLTAAIRGAGKATSRELVLVTESTVASARLYVPSDDVVRFHDAASVTSISNNGTAVSASVYQLEPVNGLSWSGEYRPYEQARMIAGGCFYRYGQKATVTVTAKWGWSAIPDEVKSAVLILAKDVVKNKDVSFGIAAFTEYAAIRRRSRRTTGWARGVVEGGDRLRGDRRVRLRAGGATVAGARHLPR
jgi:hypothetical protein